MLMVEMEEHYSTKALLATPKGQAEHEHLEHLGTIYFQKTNLIYLPTFLAASYNPKKPFL
jgi:hypothetical protein